MLPLLVLLVHGRSLSHDFVWDDNILLLGNNTYKYFDLLNILGSISNRFEYLPIRDLSYAFDYQLWGENATGFHLTNIVLAMLLSIAAYSVTKVLIKMFVTWLEPEQVVLYSLFTTAVYLLHPIQVQAIHFITCRNVLLSGLFFFLSVYFFTRLILSEGRKILWNFLLFFIFYVFALFSKGTAIILPLVTLSIALSVPYGKKKGVISSLSLLPVTVTAFLLFKHIGSLKGVIRDDILTFGALNPVINLIKSSQIPGWYLVKTFFPVNLSPQYSVDFSPLSTSVASSVAYILLAFTLFVTTMIIRKNNLIVVGSLVFFVSLLPVLNIFPTFPVVADRYMFLPLYGLVLLVIALVIELNSLYPRIGVWFCGVTIILFSLLSFSNGRYWASNEFLWRRAVAINPSDFRAWVNLGSAMMAEARYSDAFAHFKKAAEVSPSLPNFEFSKGVIEFRKINNEKALQLFYMALLRDPQNLQSNYFLAMTELRLGNCVEAARYLRSMDESMYPDPFGYLQKRNLMLDIFVAPAFERKFPYLIDSIPISKKGRLDRIYCLFLLRNYQLYLDEFKSVTDEYLDVPAHFYTMAGLSSVHLRQSKNALVFFQRALKDPNPDFEAAIYMSRQLVREHRFSEAESLLYTTIQAGSDNAIEEMALLQFRLGRKHDANYWVDRALNADGERRCSLKNLQMMLTAGR